MSRDGLTACPKLLLLTVPQNGKRYFQFPIKSCGIDIHAFSVFTVNFEDDVRNPWCILNRAISQLLCFLLIQLDANAKFPWRCPLAYF